MFWPIEEFSFKAHLIDQSAIRRTLLLLRKVHTAVAGSRGFVIGRPRFISATQRAFLKWKSTNHQSDIYVYERYLAGEEATPRLIRRIKEFPLIENWPTRNMQLRKVNSAVARSRVFLSGRPWFVFTNQRVSLQRKWTNQENAATKGSHIFLIGRTKCFPRSL